METTGGSFTGTTVTITVSDTEARVGFEAVTINSVWPFTS